jgi:hypothetical protein
MASSYNIETIQGDVLSLTLTVKDSYGNNINLSGYDVRGQVRYSYSYSGDSLLLLKFNPSIYSGTYGEYFPSGIININDGSYQTQNLPIGSFVYDIERYQASNLTGDAIKLLRGKFIVSPEVTI